MRTTVGNPRIEVVEYDPAWPVRFEREADRMRELLGENVLSIEHVGSTSVPGLAAKPIVDICPVVADTDDGERCADLLQRNGYYRSEKDRGDDWIELGRTADDGQEFNVHVRPRHSDAVTRYLLLRAYLRDHPDAREEYARVKRAAAETHPNDVSGYTREKSDIIESIVERARAEGYDPEF
ncbi:GrpB family protein [Halorussus limi]|uniref:GrpB family protein n=1 Tax=Halorussus limi TaxID=2938695 RepID=A0A8U0HX52_9EURY|nr:GrpB family protein [Halorussus limi]UPV75497.1 GrpB family protein [Halorussus limi]